MKKNLIKLLAIAAMTSSLTACSFVLANYESKSNNESSESTLTSETTDTVPSTETTEGPGTDTTDTGTTDTGTTDTGTTDTGTTEEPPVEAYVVETPEEFYELEVDYEEETVCYPLDNKLVRIEQAGLMSYEGNTGYFYWPASDAFEDGSYYPFRIFGVEARFDADAFGETSVYNWLAANNFYQFDIEGIAHQDGNTIYIDHAQLTNKSAEQMDGVYPGIPNGWGTRSRWDTAASENMHATLGTATFQICEVPELTFQEDESIFVVFPGEDYDITNEENYSPFQLTIPAGLSETSKANIRAAFEGAQVGSGINTYFVCYVGDYGLGVKLVDNWVQRGEKYISSVDIETIGSFTEVAAIAQPYFEEEIDDLGSDANIISYGVDTDYAIGDLPFSNTSYMGFGDDEAEKAFVDFTYSPKTGKNSAVVTEIKSKLASAGYSLLLTEEEDGKTYVAYATKYEDTNDTDKFVQLMYTDTSTEVYYIATRKQTPAWVASREVAQLFGGSSAWIDKDNYESKGYYLLELSDDAAEDATVAAEAANIADAFASVTGVAVVNAFAEDNGAMVARYLWSNEAVVDISISLAEGEFSYVFQISEPLPKNIYLDAAEIQELFDIDDEDVYDHYLEQGEVLMAVELGTEGTKEELDAIAATIADKLATATTATETLAWAWDDEYEDYYAEYSWTNGSDVSFELFVDDGENSTIIFKIILKDHVEAQIDSRLYVISEMVAYFLQCLGNEVTAEGMIADGWFKDSTEDESDPCWWTSVSFNGSLASTLAGYVPGIFAEEDGFVELQAIAETSSGSGKYGGYYTMAGYEDCALEVYIYVKNSKTYVQFSCYYLADLM